MTRMSNSFDSAVAPTPVKYCRCHIPWRYHKDQPTCVNCGKQRREWMTDEEKIKKLEEQNRYYYAIIKRLAAVVNKNQITPIIMDAKRAVGAREGYDK